MEQQLVRSKSRRRKMGLAHLVKACWTPPLSDCECYGDKEVIVIEQKEEEEGEEERWCCIPDDLLVECLARVPREWLHHLPMVCRKWRAILSSDNYYKMRRKLGRLEGRIVVFAPLGASTVSFSVYSQPPQWKEGQVSMEWSTEQQAQAAVVKNRIFMLGASTLVYDTWSRTVRQACPMLLPRKKFACCVISNRILVAGGASRVSGDQASLNEAEEYIPELDVWRRLPNMPRRRFGCNGAAVDGIFYVIGGIKRLCAYVGSMDSFDPSTNTWLKSKPLPMDGGCAISCTVVASCIYMLSSHAVELSFWRYDTKTQLWSRISLPPVPSPLRIDNLVKFCCVTLDTAVHVIQLGGCVDDLLRRGGRNPRGIRHGLVLVYQTHLHEWSKAPHLPQVKCGAACAVVEC